MIMTIIKKIKMKKRNNNKPTMNPDATTQKTVFCRNFPSFPHPDTLQICIIIYITTFPR